MLFLFVSHQSHQPFLRYGQNIVQPWKNTSDFFQRKFAKITVYNRTSPKSDQVITMTRAIKLPRFVISGWVSGSHFIVQRSKFLLINATTVTLDQGHGKIIRYIYQDLYILCPNHLRFSSNGFSGVRCKSRCDGGRGGNQLKTWSHPRSEWLNYWSILYIESDICSLSSWGLHGSTVSLLFREWYFTWFRVIFTCNWAGIEIIKRIFRQWALRMDCVLYRQTRYRKIQFLPC